MTRTHFTVIQNDKIIGATPIMEQAVNAAKLRAADTGKDVSVVAHYADAKDREVIYHPDGTNEKIWEIDKGKSIQPAVGEVYTNRGGGRFKCVAQVEPDTGLYYHGGGSSNTSAVMQNIKSGWTFTAKGIIQYVDGTIEWDHSVGGRFEEVSA